MDGLTGADVTGFLLRESTRVRPGSFSCHANQLRQLLRSLSMRGFADPGLAYGHTPFWLWAVRIDLRDRSVAVDERRVELSAVEYRLLCQLAGEPIRVLTKVNFGCARPRKEASDGLRAGLAIPFPVKGALPLIP